MKHRGQSEYFWRACNFDALLHETWEGETFVFNPASNETHLLNQAAFALLAYLSDTPSGTSELLERFAANTSPEIVEALRLHLQQLETIGLICRSH